MQKPLAINKRVKYMPDCDCQCTKGMTTRNCGGIYNCLLLSFAT